MVFERFKERMRQGTGLSKDMGHFKGTDNARIEQMMSEADDFASKLKSYKKHLGESTSATKGLLHSTQKVLIADLPRVYTRDEEGKAIAQFTKNNASQTVNVNGLTDLITRHEAELKTQVYAPIDQWLVTHKEFSNKISKLNNFRLDLDNARRLHNRSDLERVRHQQKSDNVPDTVLSKIQEQSTELEGRRDAWVQYESEVHAELTNLVNEAANMHVILAKALAIEADIMTSTLASGGGLGGAQLSYPKSSGGFSNFSGGGGSPLGQAASGGYTGAFGGSAAGTQNLSNPEYVQMST